MLKRDGNQYGPQYGPQVSECPSRSTTYRLHVTGSDGHSEGRTVNIWVGERQRGGPGPVIAAFDANPTRVNLNQPCTTLTWRINEPGSTRVTLYRNNFAIAWPVNTTQHVDCVPASEMGQEIAYRLQLDSEFSGWTYRAVRVAFRQ